MLVSYDTDVSSLTKDAVLVWRKFRHGPIKKISHTALELAKQVHTYNVKYVGIFKYVPLGTDQRQLIDFIAVVDNIQVDR